MLLWHLVSRKFYGMGFLLTGVNITVMRTKALFVSLVGKGREDLEGKKKKEGVGGRS